MISEQIWKRIWLVMGIIFIFLSIFMLLFAPWLASITGTAPFSDRARAMISFFWIWMLIYNGLGFILLYKDTEKYEILLILSIPAAISFTILQTIYISMGYFELVLSEIIWAASGLIWSILVVLYFFDKRQKHKGVSSHEKQT